MLNDYLLTVISNIGMISLIALSAYIILITGEISFGQQAYFGISAYAGAIATTVWGWPFWLAIIFGSSLAAIAAGIVSAMTVRISGLYFSISTLAFSEMVRLSLLKFNYQVEIDGELVGPNGAEGFGGIRWIFENNISVLEYTLLIYFILTLVILLLFFVERSSLGIIFRMLGQDPMLSRTLGLNSTIYKVLAATIAGFIAGVTVPPGKRMGHAGAIISGNKGTAESKIEALKKSNVYIAESPAFLGETMMNAIKNG